MADQIQGRQLFRYRNFHIDKGECLGHGAYGAVYKAKCDQLPCAAKVLHPTILDPADPGAGKVMQRFQQECSVLESIRHPNIVQYLGVTRDPESRLPALLMELLDESLTKMLECSRKSLAYCVQVNICHDIALAVAYLHSNDIIHRDLSSNNVLIMAKSRAKVTDFGMAKLTVAAPTTSLTMCPGTLAYMAPEALEEPPRYTKKLDCFSEGVIMIQVCTRLWPEPGPRLKSILTPASPTGVIKVPIVEAERRKKHIDMIDHSHGLLPIVLDCLHYQESERPSSEELCQRLADLRETIEYKQSVEQVEKEQSDLAEQEQRMGEMQMRDGATVQQLHDENEQLRIQNQKLSGKYQSEIEQLEEQLQCKEKGNEQLKKKLEEQEQVIAEIQQINHSLQRQVEQLQQQLSQQTPRNSRSSSLFRALFRERQPQPQDQSVKVKQLQSSLHQVQHQEPVKPTKHIMMLGEWKDGERAPFDMCRGAAVVDGHTAYFVNRAVNTCCYDSATKRWSEPPLCPYPGSSLAIIRGLLTAIGNKLVSIENGQDKRWMERFPPMPTKRLLTAAVTTKRHLIVAGGYGGSNRLNTVEVMDVDTLVWSTAASLPHPYSMASATICGNHLYMLGGSDSSGPTKSVLTCSLTKLLQSCSAASSGSVWSRIADVPAYCSTCVAVNGELVAVGGEDEDKKATAAVHKYSPTTDSWDLISNMQTARSLCLVAALPTNEMIVVGGTTDTNVGFTDKMEVVNTNIIILS